MWGGIVVRLLAHFDYNDHRSQEEGGESGGEGGEVTADTES